MIEYLFCVVLGVLGFWAGLKIGDVISDWLGRIKR